MLIDKTNNNEYFCHKYKVSNNLKDNLIFCKEIIKDAQKYIPEFLENIIGKNLFCLNFIKYPNNQIPLFNGASENYINQLEDYLETNDKKKNSENVIGGLYKLKHKNHITNKLVKPIVGLIKPSKFGTRKPFKAVLYQQ